MTLQKQRLVWMNAKSKISILEQEILGILAVDILIILLCLENAQHDIDFVAFGAEMGSRADLASHCRVEGIETLADSLGLQDYVEAGFVGRPDHGLHVG